MFDFSRSIVIALKPSVAGLVLITILLAFSSIYGCLNAPGPFNFESVAKSDINQICEIHLKRVSGLVEELTGKLYKRNPKELLKNKGLTIDQRIAQITVCPVPDEGPSELSGRKSIDAMLLGLNPLFEGDRVFAVMYGLHSMLLASYDNKCEFFFVDLLNEQKLYDSARNIEILLWRLKTRRDKDNGPLLLTNSTKGPVVNLSFERLFGKLISLQDTLAVITAEKQQRAIKKAIQITGMTFIKIPL